MIKTTTMITAQRDIPTIVTVLCQIPAFDGGSVTVTAATNLDSFFTKNKQKQKSKSYTFKMHNKIKVYIIKF